MDRDRSALVLVGYAAAYCAAVAAGVVLQDGMLAGVAVVGLVTAAIAWRLVVAGSPEDADMGFVVALSAFQNVVLGLLAPLLDDFAVRLLLSVNILLPLGWLVSLWLLRTDSWRFRGNAWANGAVLATGGVLVFSVLRSGFNGTAAVASLRNLITPVVFITLGSLASGRNVASGKLSRIILALGFAVILTGVVERFLLPDMWRWLNITALWQRKGLTNLAASGLPANWISAEEFGGHPVRRMVSSFADPVNLGTFLFLVVALAWFQGRRVLMTIGVVGIVLTVSKGGLLGLLVFACVYGYIALSRRAFAAIAIAAAAAGVGFIYYSLHHASGSLLLHVAGAVHAVLDLVRYPLGRGLGQVGTLSQQFTWLGRQDILESGFGMVIGQLGLPGLLLYIGLFAAVLRICLRGLGERERVLALGLLFGIGINIVFNEVALSPNSSAPYFFLLGGLCREARARPATNAQQARADTLERGAGGVTA